MAKRNRNHLRAGLAGEYLMDQFFFKIYAEEPRPPVIDQRQLQSRYMVTILHEYVHYLHEISTHLGTMSMLYAVAFRSLLSNYVSRNLQVSDFSINWTAKDIHRISAVDSSLDVMMGDIYYADRSLLSEVAGDVITRAVLQIPFDGRLIEQAIDVPVIQITSGSKTIDLRFGKFFIYEGLAYELELVYAGINGINHPDEMDGSEYTVLRNYGEYLHPGISRYALLTLAAFSLAYVDSGRMFKTFVDAMALDCANGSSESRFLENNRAKIRQEYRKMARQLQGVLDEVETAYQKRSALVSTFQHLRQNYTTAIHQRIENPAFEVDLVFSNDIDGLLNTVPPCDYMVVFNDEDPYMRDFIGTTRSQRPNGMELARDYQAFACHIHYTNILFSKAAGFLENLDEAEELTCCPYYSGCDLKFRRLWPEVCAHTPWNTFDFAAQTDNRHCSYGQGVLLTKGQDMP